MIGGQRQSSLTAPIARKLNRDLVLGWLVLLGWSLNALFKYWDNWPIDLSALYFAAHFYAEGAFDLVYAPGGDVFWVTPPLEWTNFAATQGLPDAILPAYVYPPVWAALLAPVTEVLSFQSFARVALLFFVGSICLMVQLSWLMARRLPNAQGHLMSFTVWAFLAAILMTLTSLGALVLQLGQPQIVVSAIILGSLWSLMRRKDVTAGGLLALAAAIKLMPALLAVLFLMERRWRALGAFLVIGGVLGFAAVAVTGWPLHRELLDRIQGLDAQILVSRLNASVELVLYHVAELINGTATWAIDKPYMVDQPGWIGLTTKVFLIAGLWLSYQATTGYSDDQRLWMRFLLVFLIVLLAAPLAWIHYLFLPMLMLPGLHAWGGPRWVLAALVGLGFAVSFPIFLFVLATEGSGFAQVYLHMGIVAALILVLVAALRQTSR